jgi:energy-coupling factor transport system permease protein
MSARRFDPRAKGIVYLCAVALALLATAPPELAALVALEGALLAALGLARAGLRVARLLLPTLLLFVIVVWWGAGVEAAVGAALRLLALAGAGVLFFGTTPPEELGEACQASGLSPQAAYLLEGTLRFVPAMGALFGEVRDAQASRGIRFDGLHLLRNGPALLAPVLVSALRLADELAEALESRGFGSPRRTLLRDYRWTARDWLLAAGATAATALAAGWLILM